MKDVAPITKEQARRMREALRSETFGRLKGYGNKPITVKLAPGSWTLIEYLLEQIEKAEEAPAVNA